MVVCGSTLTLLRAILGRNAKHERLFPKRLLLILALIVRDRQDTVRSGTNSRQVRRGPGAGR